ncbi:SDR family oxidoreductase [Ancylobacter polymorphus]|uniref:Peroxisomal trans-2-enoyl-CoA reductase n=1 Tax=Ancylobacter polymorphus TaxID=223390 RepID=A0A9E7ABP2_9HYPH|nr:SDR family oxidoreductase [Ancylobacter polymorphus]UOK73323.1 SDR family oxidoreductase [Ancylobacter polymorphus]
MSQYSLTDDQLAELPTVFAPGIFAGQLALISGGGTGIGKATAALYARLGANLAICGRDGERLEEAAAFLRRFGTTVTTHQMTIRDPEQVSALIDEVWKMHGRLDILVNNAGGQFAQAALDIKPKGWNAVVDTNLNGTFYMMQQAALRWRDSGKPGNIVNVVAVVSRGLPTVAHTCAARAGQIFLSKTVATEWAPYNIRVNCVAPGTIATDAFNYYPPEGQASFFQANPMKRAGDVQDIAEAIIYLTAPSGKYITGELLIVDGGQQNWGDPWFAGRPEYFELDYEKSRQTSR